MTDTNFFTIPTDQQIREQPQRNVRRTIVVMGITTTLFVTTLFSLFVFKEKKEIREDDTHITDNPFTDPALSTNPFTSFEGDVVSEYVNPFDVFIEDTKIISQIEDEQDSYQNPF